MQLRPVAICVLALSLPGVLATVAGLTVSGPDLGDGIAGRIAAGEIPCVRAGEIPCVRADFGIVEVEIPLVDDDLFKFQRRSRMGLAVGYGVTNAASQAGEVSGHVVTFPPGQGPVIQGPRICLRI
jgi:hypothetical protein